MAGKEWPRLRYKIEFLKTKMEELENSGSNVTVLKTKIFKIKGKYWN
jgi:hypothetical protein